MIFSPHLLSDLPDHPVQQLLIFLPHHLLINLGCGLVFLVCLNQTLNLSGLLGMEEIKKRKNACVNSVGINVCSLHCLARWWQCSFFWGGLQIRYVCLYFPSGLNVLIYLKPSEGRGKSAIHFTIRHCPCFPGSQCTFCWTFGIQQATRRVF